MHLLQVTILSSLSVCCFIEVCIRCHLPDKRFCMYFQWFYFRQCSTLICINTDTCALLSFSLNCVLLEHEKFGMLRVKCTKHVTSLNNYEYIFAVDKIFFQMSRWCRTIYRRTSSVKYSGGIGCKYRESIITGSVNPVPVQQANQEMHTECLTFIQSIVS